MAKYFSAAFTPTGVAVYAGAYALLSTQTASSPRLPS